MINKIRKYVNVIFIISIIAIIFLCVGCATMALSPGMKTLDLTQKSFALMTIKVSNKFKPDYQPELSLFFVREVNSTFSKSFNLGTPHKQVTKEYNEYLVSMNLIPGKYMLEYITGSGEGFLVSGSCEIHINKNFELEPNQVVYLGHIEAVNRERKNDSEKRAGPLLPLVDQQATGFYKGTFDITFSDSYDDDVAFFKMKYPVLGNYTIENKSLSN